MKEPGQLLFEIERPDREFYKWDVLYPETKAQWASIEAAIRSAVLEEAAKVAEQCWSLYPTQRDWVAAEIRALANPSPAAPCSPSEPGQSEPQGG
jgi:hypothetical protein